MAADCRGLRQQGNWRIQRVNRDFDDADAVVGLYLAFPLLLLLETTGLRTGCSVVNVSACVKLIKPEGSLDLRLLTLRAFWLAWPAS